MKNIFVLLFLVLSACSPPKTESQSVTLAIEGMTCQACVNGITAQLTKTPGVLTCNVSLENNSAVVQFDPSRLSAEQAAQRINQLGFKARIATP